MDVVDPSVNVSGAPGIPSSGVSLRTTKPTWSKKPNVATQVFGYHVNPAEGTKLFMMLSRVNNDNHPVLNLLYL